MSKTERRGERHLPPFNFITVNLVPSWKIRKRLHGEVGLPVVNLWENPSLWPHIASSISVLIRRLGEGGGRKREKLPLALKEASVCFLISMANNELSLWKSCRVPHKRASFLLKSLLLVTQSPECETTAQIGSFVPTQSSHKLSALVTSKTHHL